MKKCFGYVVPVLFCIAAVTVIFVGYFQYEYKANMAHGIAAPIGVSLCFVCFCVAELVCVRLNKFNAAIVLAIIKFGLLFFGIISVFSHTLTGLGFMLILSMAIPVFLPVALVGLTIRVLFFVALIIFYTGIVIEPVILALCQKRKAKPLQSGEVREDG